MHGLAGHAVLPGQGGFRDAGGKGRQFLISGRAGAFFCEGLYGIGNLGRVAVRLSCGGGDGIDKGRAGKVFVFGHKADGQRVDVVTVPGVSFAFGKNAFEAFDVEPCVSFNGSIPFNYAADFMPWRGCVIRKHSDTP